MKRSSRKVTRRTRTRRKGPTYPPRVVVKFRDDIELPYDEHVDQYLDRLQVGPWRKLLEQYPGIVIRPLIKSVKPNRVRELVAEAERIDPTYRPPNFLTYFVVEVPVKGKVKGLAKELSTWGSVQAAYYDPPGEDPNVNPNDPRLPRQGYLDMAPEGIDAKFAWEHQGGDGAGQQIIDLEQGWTLDHEDLLALGANVLFGSIMDESRPHGTSVLGVVCAESNQFGGCGIAPNVASVNVVSYSGNMDLVVDSIFAAMNVLPSGGVLLLEVQKDSYPIETLLGEFDAIRQTTAKGITVIEAAGNGGFNLDNFTDVAGNRVLNRGDPNFKDSRAILVGAATSTVPHLRMSFSNYGSRIDCYGWGENVFAPTSTMSMPFGTKKYTRIFDGTSSAAPMIAGAALLIQGMATISLGHRLNPLQMRALLGNPATGTPTGTATNYAVVKPIGVMPDLRAIIGSNAIGVVPRLAPPQR